MQRLTKAHTDALVTDFVAGGATTAKGRTRRPWSADSVNKVIGTVEQVLADAESQGLVARNVARLVNRVAIPHQEVDTYSEVEVQRLLASITGDRIRHAWELELSGLRRGEIAGLRWSDVDLDAKTLSVANNRVDACGTAVENDPKSATSRRTLPLPERLVTVLRPAKARQGREKLALGADGGPWE